MFKFSGKNLEEWTISRKMTRQKEQEDKAENQNGDRKGESTDSPEIPDRGEASDIPGLPLGKKRRCTALYIYNQSHTIMVHKSWHEQWNKVRKQF